MFLASRIHVLQCVTYFSPWLSFFLFIWVSGENLPSSLRHKSFLSVHKSGVCVCAHLHPHIPCHIEKAGLVSFHVERHFLCCGRTLSQFLLLFCITHFIQTHRAMHKSIVESHRCWPVSSHPEKKAHSYSENHRYHMAACGTAVKVEQPPAFISQTHTIIHTETLQYTDTETRLGHSSPTRPE